MRWSEVERGRLWSEGGMWSDGGCGARGELRKKKEKRTISNS